MTRSDWSETLVMLPRDLRALEDACRSRKWRMALRALAEAQARLTDLRKTLEHADRTARTWE